jgi:hypothetical protein
MSCSAWKVENEEDARTSVWRRDHHYRANLTALAAREMRLGFAPARTERGVLSALPLRATGSHLAFPAGRIIFWRPKCDNGAPG